MKQQSTIKMQTKWKQACLAEWDQQCMTTNQVYKKQRKASETTTQTYSLSNQQIDQIIHTVTPNDTIQGISIMYNVKVQEIRARNNLSSNQIYFVNVLHIPGPKFIKKISQADQREIIVSAVMKKLKLGEEDQAEIRGILEQVQWNEQNAIKKYRQDTEWQNRYADILSTFQNKKHKSPFFAIRSINTS